MQQALNLQNAGQYREALPYKNYTRQGTTMTISTAALLITEIGVIVGAVSSAVIWGRRIIEGVRCQLRADILNTYYKCKDEKKIRQYEAEHFDKCYHAYKALKGNSFIDEIYKKAHGWEVIT